MAFLQRTKWMILVTTMLAYLSSFQTVSGIKCYQCQTAFHNDCGKEGTAKECPSSTTTCYELSTEIEGAKAIVRDCISGEVGCTKEDKNGVKFETCFCNTDSCNNKMSQGSGSGKGSSGSGKGSSGTGSSFKSEFGQICIMFIGTIFIITGFYWS